MRTQLSHLAHLRLPIRRARLILGIACALGVGLGVVLSQTHETVSITTEEVESQGLQVQDRALAPFHGLHFTRRDGGKATVEVMILAGDEPSVAVVAQAGQHHAVQARVVDDILHIQINSDLADLGKLRIKLASPKLRSLHIDGPSTVRVNGGIRSEAVKIKAIRGAQITARRLGAQRVEVTALQGGSVLLGGTTDLLKAQAEGGKINAQDLRAEVAQVSSIRDSRIELSALDRLEAHARGRASILYRMRPKHLLQDLDHSSKLGLL